MAGIGGSVIFMAMPPVLEDESALCMPGMVGVELPSATARATTPLAASKRATATTLRDFIGTSPIGPQECARRPASTRSLHPNYLRLVRTKSLTEWSYILLPD